MMSLCVRAGWTCCPSPSQAPLGPVLPGVFSSASVLPAGGEPLSERKGRAEPNMRNYSSPVYQWIHVRGQILHGFFYVPARSGPSRQRACLNSKQPWKLGVMYFSRRIGRHTFPETFQGNDYNALSFPFPGTFASFPGREYSFYRAKKRSCIGSPVRCAQPPTVRVPLLGCGHRTLRSPRPFPRCPLGTGLWGTKARCRSGCSALCNEWSVCWPRDFYHFISFWLNKLLPFPKGES